MPKSSSSGNIIHAVAARYRVKGRGLLRTRLLNMGEITTDTNSLRFTDLEPIEMNASSNREKTAITNFQDQAIQLQFRTTHINETFTISVAILFIKAVAEGYPIISGGN